MKPLPSSDQIQDWIRGIQPYEYFERITTQAGMLVLRAKDPVCSWRGLHMALSDDGRNYLRDHLLSFSSGTVSSHRHQCSLPDGRSWFELYTSGVDFGSWWKIDFEISNEAPSLLVRYAHSTVQVRLSRQSACTLANELSQSLQGGVRSELATHREVRPSSEPQALWLWHWPAGRGAG